MYVLNFELRWDNGDLTKLTERFNQPSLTDADYQWLLEVYTKTNTVELHLINFTFSGEPVATFPSSLSNASVEVEWV